MLQRWKEKRIRKKAAKLHKKRREKMFAERQNEIKRPSTKIVKKDNLFLGMLFRFQKRSDKRDKKRKVISYSAILLTTVCIAAIAFIFWGPIFRISEIRIEIVNNSLLKEKIIEDSMEQYLKKSLFFVHENNIRFDLQNKFIEVSDIQCNKIYPKLLDCDVFEYSSALAIRKGNNQNIEYIVNQIGNIIRIREVVNDGMFIQVNNTNPDMMTNLGDKIIDENEIEFLYRAKNSLEDRSGISVTDIWWLQKEREVHLYNELGFIVKMTLERPLEDQISDLMTVFTQRNLGNSLEYIDLRVPGKVFLQ